MKPSIHIKFKPLGLGLVCTAVTAMATCYVEVQSSIPCHEVEMEDCTNGCVRITYTPAFQSYCDSHDGECGWTNCRIVDSPVAKFLNYFEIVGDGDGCRCEPPVRTYGPFWTGDTCPRAELSGDRCGYCP